MRIYNILKHLFEIKDVEENRIILEVEDIPITVAVNENYVEVYANPEIRREVVEKLKVLKNVDPNTFTNLITDIRLILKNVSTLSDVRFNSEEVPEEFIIRKMVLTEIVEKNMQYLVDVIDMIRATVDKVDIVMSSTFETLENLADEDMEHIYA